eukprot:COSAG02_NODE_2508_length_8634_cov_2.849326_5_plen_860_part_00
MLRFELVKQIENTALKVRMAELEQALQGAGQSCAQAIQTAQVAHERQRAAEAQLLQAQQAAQAAAAQAEAADAARAAQAAQLAQALRAMNDGQKAQTGSAMQLQRPHAGSSRQPGDTIAAAASSGQPLQTQRSRSTPAPEESERKIPAKKPRVTKDSAAASQSPQRARPAAAAAAAAAEPATAGSSGTTSESSADDDRTSAQHKPLEQSQTAPSITGNRGRTRVGGSRITALAAEGGHLFAAGVDNSLWKRSLNTRSDRSGNDTSWEQIGSAVNVVAMATLARRVYALDSSSSIWCLDLYGSNPTWELWDDPPPPIKQHGIELPERRVSLTATPDGYIWVATLSNNLLRASVKQGTDTSDDSVSKAVCWERVRESVGVSGLVVIPSGSHTLSSKTDWLIIAACEDSKIWHWKPPRAAAHDATRSDASCASTNTKEKAWCPCGATPVKPDRGIAYGNGSVFVAGPTTIHVAEVGDVQDGAPASLEWSTSGVPLPPIVINSGIGSLADRYSPSRENAKPQQLGKEDAEIRGSRPNEPRPRTQKVPAPNKKTDNSIGRKSASRTPQVQLKSPDGKEYFEVERILDKRPLRGRKRKPGAPAGSMFEYKVKWLNFDKPSDNTWEPWENICNCREVLAAYEAIANGTADSDNTRMRVGGKKPRSAGAQNTVTGRGFVGGKRPRPSSSDGNGVRSSTSAHRNHDTAASNGTEGDGGALKSRTSLTSTAKLGQVPGHTVQRPRAQRLAKTAALHPSVAAEYQQADDDAATGGRMPTVRSVAIVVCISCGSCYVGVESTDRLKLSIDLPCLHSPRSHQQDLAAGCTSNMNHQLQQQRVLTSPPTNLCRLAGSRQSRGRQATPITSKWR